MNFLCICEWGHSRSVALARVFHGLGHGAVSIGRGSNGGAISVLSAWADTIAILDDCFLDCVPSEHKHKVVSFHVGPDRWVNPYNDELSRILSDKVTEFFRSRK